MNAEVQWSVMAAFTLFNSGLAYTNLRYGRKRNATQDTVGVADRLARMEATHVERCKFTDQRFDALAQGVAGMNALQGDVRELREDVKWLTKSLEQIWADRLHAPTHYERDELVQKMVDRKATCAELKRAIVLLDKAARDPEEEPDADKRLIAGALCDRARLLLARKRREKGGESGASRLPGQQPTCR